MLKLASFRGVQSISRGLSSGPQQEHQAGGAAPLWRLFQAGQLLELSGRAPGKLSAVVQLIVRAQAEQEPVAWVALRDVACFYPPDFARAGVDLTALTVVRLSAELPKGSSVSTEAGSHGLVRAAEVLLRSGAFGLVVIDLSRGIPRGELSWQARLSGLLRRHDARAVVLTESRAKEPSLGPLVSLRVEARFRAGERHLCARGSARRVLLEQSLLKCKLGMNVAISPDVRSLPEGA